MGDYLWLTHIVGIVGLKQEGGELFINVFRKYLRYRESNKESKLKKSICPSYKTVLVDLQKINILFYVIQPGVFINS